MSRYKAANSRAALYKRVARRAIDRKKMALKVKDKAIIITVLLVLLDASTFFYFLVIN